MNGVLRDGRFQKLILANILSSIGSGVTMIGVPWLLVNKEDGSQIYGYAAFCMTLLLFFLSPYLGVWIDRVSRKRVLLLSEAFGFMVAFFFAGWGWLTGGYETWHLISMYAGGSLYYALHYPAQFAFNQEIFTREQYRELNSVMEIQNQAASMLAGGLTSVLLDRIDFSFILIADALTYAVGFVLISLIPYASAGERKDVSNASVWENMKEGFMYIKDKPLFAVFYLSSFMPFIGVMVGNYLFPIYIADTLGADGTVMGLADTMYAAGAILGGYTIPFLLHKQGEFRTVLFTVGIYTAGTLLIALFPIVGFFLMMKILLGWGNSGARVARNTIMMNEVPNEVMGRVNSFFAAVGMLLRVSLIGLFARTVAHTGASFSLLVVGGLLLLACGGVLISRSLFVSKEVPTLSKSS
ncbi:MFS transporter [Aneurinibacillus sp. BA2021]|nr:MFS transporter [Aneurinibacillus sp. BA2021]